jgi:hypothetical protein
MPSIEISPTPAPFNSSPPSCRLASCSPLPTLPSQNPKPSAAAAAAADAEAVQPCTPSSAAPRPFGGAPCPRSRPRCSSSSRRRWMWWPGGGRSLRPRGSTPLPRGWGSGRRGPQGRRRARSSRRTTGRSTRRTRRRPPAPVRRRRGSRFPSLGSRPRSSKGSPARASPSCSPSR